jgi:hypothetical protein
MLVPIFVISLLFANVQQAHAFLAIVTGNEAPSLDLLAFQRDAAAPHLEPMLDTMCREYSVPISQILATSTSCRARSKRASTIWQTN